MGEVTLSKLDEVLLSIGVPESDLERLYDLSWIVGESVDRRAQHRTNAIRDDHLDMVRVMGTMMASAWAIEDASEDFGWELDDLDLIELIGEMMEAGFNYIRRERIR